MPARHHQPGEQPRRGRMGHVSQKRPKDENRARSSRCPTLRPIYSTSSVWRDMAETAQAAGHRRSDGISGHGHGHSTVNPISRVSSVPLAQ